MAPHLGRAKSTYKGLQILIFYITHYNSINLIHVLLVMGW